ncbi:bacteriochlorophyll synthase [Acidiphilium multivorum AIU301]|uniref:Bacteriochlorophyll synthase n=1 Tax=Acidiphilium multivorum (strain DSM 11245 / JCM 8867 / NBRC 100883 / AIU 301) TaxID=926570 RepID=F0IZM9_ACIMA|nr:MULTISPECIES: chlorophyll synthase ChlG [Acidiphilium]OYW11930.1 MAG: bacteriochlorophyll/chlorophyll a synthase [Acidiphilium sp. 37-67-22]BAJ81239.1 bacteriochlorophyll synthase [Acidiphilium multivorum AIU301]GAN73410.1 bacteriochlorophyll synthase [Acidiphilium multivorum AIU301]HQT72811.1 chlorophyll synthase ChlG [Acidiphilium sp.]
MASAKETNLTLAPLRVAPASLPGFRVCLELLKPVTWFAAIWAFVCGAVSSGAPLAGRWPELLLGMVLAGPMVCGTSQAVNDWFDRHVDAINEPDRPIPSGRMPGRWGLYVALIWTALSLAVAVPLGRWGFGAAVFALLAAWAYSAPPLRLKRNGWWGNAAVALCYEGVPWFTGAAVMRGALPSAPVLWLALLYSFGAHGIMTLNDFKSVEGDRRSGIRSLPVQLGVAPAARLACVVMALPQLVVIGLMIAWDHRLAAFAVGLLLACQLGLMGRLLQRPRERAPWYNATGTTLYVIGMLVCAFALAGGGA